MTAKTKVAKKRMPKFEWAIIIPSKTSAPAKRHAMASLTASKAVCGAEYEPGTSRMIFGPKTIQSHPVCGRCQAHIDRMAMMIGK